MSYARRASNKRKHELENEKPTRKSARLKNLQGTTLQLMSLERKMTKQDRLLEASPGWCKSIQSGIKLPGMKDYWGRGGGNKQCS